MSIYIETPRLIVRTPVIDDIDRIQAAKIAAWNDLRLWMSWAVPGTETLEAMHGFIAFAKEKNHLIAVTKDKGEFVLCTGATPLTDKGSFEVGYWAAREMRGHGYATEASNAVIRYAFSALKAAEIYICYFEGNAPSRNVIEKLAFQKTGIVPKAHTRDIDGAVLDKHEYIMRDLSVLPDLDVQWRERCP